MGSRRCSQFFSGLPPEDLSAIAAFVVRQTLAKGDYLFHEGEPARGCYLGEAEAAVWRVLTCFNDASAPPESDLFHGTVQFRRARQAGPGARK